jgi:hypothetical protein
MGLLLQPYSLHPVAYSGNSDFYSSLIENPVALTEDSRDAVKFGLFKQTVVEQFERSHVVSSSQFSVPAPLDTL